MGTYGLNAEEVADAMEEAKVESFCEGDFYEETFLEGAKIYIDRLRKQGAFVYTDKKKEIKKFIKEIRE